MEYGGPEIEYFKLERIGKPKPGDLKSDILKLMEDQIKILEAFVANEELSLTYPGGPLIDDEHKKILGHHRKGVPTYGMVMVSNENLDYWLPILHGMGCDIDRLAIAYSQLIPQCDEIGYSRNLEKTRQRKL